MKTRLLGTIATLALSAITAPGFAPAQTAGVSGSPAAPESQNRSHLPLPNTLRPNLITYDAKDPDSKFPPIPQLRPPKGAPNVLIVLIDDVGFGASSAFGGPCQTPTLEHLANAGLRYNRFHTTALCSPTRQALLTGRNHHSAGMGGITEIATGAPGYSSVLPNSMAPLGCDPAGAPFWGRFGAKSGVLLRKAPSLEKLLFVKKASFLKMLVLNPHHRRGRQDGSVYREGCGEGNLGARGDRSSRRRLAGLAPAAAD